MFTLLQNYWCDLKTLFPQLGSLLPKGLIRIQLDRGIRPTPVTHWPSRGQESSWHLPGDGEEIPPRMINHGFIHTKILSYQDSILIVISPVQSRYAGDALDALLGWVSENS